MSSADPEVEKSENELNKSNISNAGENTHDSQEEADSVLDSASHTEEGQKEKLVQLPLGRVKTIVKMDPDVNLVNQEAIFLITKSTELFIESLTKEAYEYTSQSKKKTVQKQDVQSAIENADALVFLEGMM